jgi:hypothetical protein
MKRAKIAFALAFSFSVLSSLQPVKAASLLDAINDILDIPASAVGTTFDAAGAALNTVDALTGLPVGLTHDDLVLRIGSRYSDFDRYIAEGLASGRLSAAQATELRAELGRIQGIPGTVTLSAVPNDRLLVVARDLDTFGLRLHQMLVLEPAFQPILVATITQPAVISTTLAVPSDIPNRFNELNTRIDDWAATGRLSAAERNELKCAMGQISAATQRMAADGLSYVESRDLYKAMDKVGGEVNLRGLDEDDRNDFVGLRTTSGGLL